MLQLFASDDIAGTFDQRLQYLQRLPLHPQLDAMLPQLARASVELEDAESQDSARIARAVGGERGHQPRPLNMPRTGSYFIS